MVLAAAYQHSLIGRRLDVLIEGAYPKRHGYVIGTSCRYAPVVLEGYLPALLSRRVPVQAVAVSEGLVFAHPEPQSIPRGRVSLPQVLPEIHEPGTAFGPARSLAAPTREMC